MATATEPEIDGGIMSQKSPGPFETTYLDSSIYGMRKSAMGGAVPKDRERKIGHRRVDEKTGTVTYKKKSTSELQAAIQLGIGQSVGGLSSKPERDLLMQDFGVVQSVVFPNEGSNITPAHHYSDFKFKTYAPLAFRYFRELFNIRPDDFMLSLCDEPMTELSNPGAGGSIFYISADDEFIIKTAQHKEASFLQKLLPGYYMNLNQNPRTLLPKFYGLYCYQCGGKNIRFVVMNNILPSVIQMHEKYDLKGSTYKRKASKSERAKKSPTLKDLDFNEIHPEGLLLEKDTYDALVKTIQRDCRVLESFKIMDYSLLVGIHNLDLAKREKGSSDKGSTDGQVPSSGLGSSQGTSNSEVLEGKTRALARGKSIRTKVTQYSTPMESIQAEVNRVLEEFDDDDIPPGGIPAKNAKGDRLLLYLGIIDVLQYYRMRKKLEHSLKSMITDGDTVSVTRPSFYADRFQKFFTNTVFKKAPSPLKHSPSKRKPGVRTTSMNEDPAPGTIGARPDLLMGSSTPPPPFSEAIAAGARPRDRMSVSPLSSRKGSDGTPQRYDRPFQTIQQQQDESFRGRMRHSPLSMSESTPTYTEFTEGTPSYTASSPSCSSEVLDSNIPGLPMERNSQGLSNESLEESSPSKVMVTSSSTDASYYSTVSHLEPQNNLGGSDTLVSSTTGVERQKSNTQTVSSVQVHVDSGKDFSDVTEVSVRDNTEHQGHQDTLELGHRVSANDMQESSDKIHTTKKVTQISITASNEEVQEMEPRVSVGSYRSSTDTDTSFSTQTGSESFYTESVVSQSTVASSESGVTDLSLSKGDSAEAFKSDKMGKKEETINEVDESTYL